MINQGYLNELAADIAYAWDLHIEYSNNKLRVQTSGDDGEAVCYLCLDAEDDGAGQPLRRDCACRGTDAGFVHLSCLTEYAETKSKIAGDMNEFRKPWRECPGCHQYYQNELAVDIARKFVLFVRRQYPHGDTQKQVESLHLKLRALNSMFERLQPVETREAEVTANVLLSLIDRMKGELSLLPRRYSEFQADAYNVHGRLAFAEGTENSTRRAVAYFEKYLAVYEAIGNDEGIASAKGNIAAAKAIYEGYEDLLKTSRELYDLRVATYGEGNESTIDSGLKHANVLRDANRWGEAMDLLTKLLATSKQVLGHHHKITKDIESKLKQIILKIKVANQS
jgi:tetratricopeptide (TPR) repeat protein